MQNLWSDGGEAEQRGELSELAPVNVAVCVRKKRGCGRKGGGCGPP